MNKILFLALLILFGAASAHAQKATTDKPVASKARNAATSKTASIKMTEAQKIDLLIKQVEKSNLHFIRNGTEYDSKKAAAHLRDKFDYANKRPRLASQVATARDFIKNIAEKSYLSGKPYQIKYPDGKLVPSGEWLLKRLEELEKNGPPAVAADQAGTTGTAAKKK